MVCHQTVDILHPSKLANSDELLFKSLIPQVTDLLQSYEFLRVSFPLPVQSKAKISAASVDVVLHSRQREVWVPARGPNVVTHIKDRHP